MELWLASATAKRPRYGFYVDHMIDSFGSLALMGGLALSGYMHPAIAVGLSWVSCLLSIQSYLATYHAGESSSFPSGASVPTELRILLAGGNLALFRWPIVLPGRYRLFDTGGVVGLTGHGHHADLLHRKEQLTACIRKKGSAKYEWPHAPGGSSTR